TRKTWHWTPSRAVPLLVLFLSFDIPFFAANILKFPDGGYIPITVGAMLFAVMLDWHVGRQHLRRLLERDAKPLPSLFERLSTGQIHRVPGTAIYLIGTEGVPRALEVQVSHTGSVAATVVLVTVSVTHDPRAKGRRHEVERLPHGFLRVTLRFGYME